MNNQPCIARQRLINLNPDEHNEELCNNPFMVSLDRSNGSYDFFDDLTTRICVPNKIEGASLNIFNMTT